MGLKTNLGTAAKSAKLKTGLGKKTEQLGAWYLHIRNLHPKVAHDNSTSESASGSINLRPHTILTSTDKRHECAKAPQRMNVDDITKHLFTAEETRGDNNGHQEGVPADIPSTPAGLQKPRPGFPNNMPRSRFHKHITTRDNKRHIEGMLCTDSVDTTRTKIAQAPDPKKTLARKAWSLD